MKKKLPGRGLLSPFTKKILLAMRLTLFFVVMSFISAYSSSYAQKGKVNLVVRNTQLKEVLNKIEKQSEFFFMYDNKQVDVERKVNVDINSENIDQVLKKLFEDADINFKVFNRQILLFPKKLTNDFIQQGKKITGIVVDETTGLTLPGVSIMMENIHLIYLMKM
jgi:TonB-dependent starch-binding outer membrane protein SusC